MSPVRTSRFNLIDLAGSERQKSALTAGKQLKEASAINKSLSALGNVINALVDNANGKDRHIHYRSVNHLLPACMYPADWTSSPTRFPPVFTPQFSRIFA
jgi:hypothetical protein